jgi:hypothetical protein
MAPEKRWTKRLCSKCRRRESEGGQSYCKECRSRYNEEYKLKSRGREMRLRERVRELEEKIRELEAGP